MKKLAIIVSSVLLTTGMLAPVRAETVVERITRTGVLNAGTRIDAIPFAYIDQDGVWKGYSIEMLSLIKARLERETGKKIQLKLARVSFINRIASVQNGEVDIFCGPTTLNRDTFLIDFSVGYFLTGTQLLVKKNRGPVTPGQWMIGVIPQTANQSFIRERFPIATTLAVKNRADGIAALENGRIDALASDGVLLTGLKQSQSHPDDFELTPTKPLTTEEYACILPKGDTQFRNLVNRSLIEFMQAVLNNSQQTAIFDRWFGPAGVAPINRQPIMDYFRQTVMSHKKQADVNDGK